MCFLIPAGVLLVSGFVLAFWREHKAYKARAYTTQGAWSPRQQAHLQATLGSRVTAAAAAKAPTRPVPMCLTGKHVGRTGPAMCKNCPQRATP